jgi:hypothetical protein
VNRTQTATKIKLKRDVEKKNAALGATIYPDAASN